MVTMEVKAPSAPFYEVTAHVEGEAGPAVLTLWTPEQHEVVRHIHRWEKDGYDVLAYHVTGDGRTRIYPNGEAA